MHFPFRLAFKHPLARRNHWFQIKTISGFQATGVRHWRGWKTNSLIEIMKRVLLVEDDEADAELVENAVRRHAAILQLERAPSADAAWDLLRHRALSGRSKRPVCVLLDMVMGAHDGIWLLERMSGHPALCDIPVLALSQRPDAVRQAREFANVVGAVEKPADETDRRRLVGDLLRLAGAMGVWPGPRLSPPDPLS
jgi:CheY-like chemotaxis protein